MDGNGWIDAMELKRFFRKIAGESQLERRRTAAELLRFFDRNGDGVIDVLEFELGCLAVQHSEGDDFIQNKLELLFAAIDTSSLNPLATPQTQEPEAVESAATASAPEEDGQTVVVKKEEHVRCNSKRNAPYCSCMGEAFMRMLVTLTSPVSFVAFSAPFTLLCCRLG